jgi:lipoate-protein ligase A
MSPSQSISLIEFADLDAYHNMALDLHLFQLCEGRPDRGYLRFYTWTHPTLSLGFFEDITVIDRARAERDGVEIVRRPTGGRVVLHGDDLTYAVVMPKVSDCGLTAGYRMISECIVRGFSMLGLALEIQRGGAAKTRSIHKPCFTSVSRYEVTFGGKKIVGSAQKVGADSILQHGSIPLGPGYQRVADYMDCPDAERARLRRETAAGTCCVHEVLPSRPEARAVASALTAGFAECFAVPEAPCGIDRFVADIDSIAESLKKDMSGP